jgi:hypothetical protein
LLGEFFLGDNDFRVLFDRFGEFFLGDKDVCVLFDCFGDFFGIYDIIYK